MQYSHISSRVPPDPDFIFDSYVCTLKGYHVYNNPALFESMFQKAVLAVVCCVTFWLDTKYCQLWTFHKYQSSSPEHCSLCSYFLNKCFLQKLLPAICWGSGHTKYVRKITKLSYHCLPKRLPSKGISGNLLGYPGLPFSFQIRSP